MSGDKYTKISRDELDNLRWGVALKKLDEISFWTRYMAEEIYESNRLKRLELQLEHGTKPRDWEEELGFRQFPHNWQSSL